MKDNFFAAIAADYAAFRPRYPAGLFRFLASLAPQPTLAWDCATGNGQAAVELAEHFEHVIGTDVSAEMLAHAPSHPRITFRRADACASGLASASVSLVTVANALHWFHGAAFEREVRRVSVPGGVIAAWSYAYCEVSPAIDALMRHVHDVVVDPFWIEPNRLVERGYRDVSFPFERIEAPRFDGHSRFDLQRFMGYMSTWSAAVKYRRHHGRDPLDEVREALLREWGDPAVERDVRWQLHLLVGRVRRGGPEETASRASEPSF